MLELSTDSSNEQTPPDDLFLERFEAFMAKSLAEIRAFSEREAMSFEKTRRRVAQWHSKYLFQPPDSSSVDPPASEPSEDTRVHEIRGVLVKTSQILEDLWETAGVESFLLAVDLRDSSNEGFLGGSVAGREFWRGLRNGGEHGARIFKQHCLKNKDVSSAEEVGSTSSSGDISTSVSVPTTPRQSAKSVKQELYENVRNALRLACGIRNAEMKWTNPERLQSYGVHLLGWPNDIPLQNPSSLKTSQNKRLLDLLENGIMKFVKITTSNDNEPAAPIQNSSAKVDDDSDTFLTWIHFDGGSLASL
ncbi:hypothetical protein D9758_003691 [Tetrapyrgos nigripes]|uniref:Uncharacterized protein n=1 Tax=Tetrapyrgos nigripes TaxID=182062 RepID=A0A8H5GMA0_9AGAR|nr:hypothetical protein D9758_003691 [Tetrapyrgos nigripes]